MKFFKKQKKKTFQHLCPHSFNSKIEYVSTPHIYITPTAYKDMCALIDIVDTEVGWEGTVEKIGANYLIKEIFLMEQLVHETTTIITNDGQSNLAMELFEKHPDEAIDILNELRFWGHSHVMMTTNPSSQDDTQMDLFHTDGVDFFIRGIGNKLGRLEFTVYLYDLGIIIYDAPWHLYDPETSVDTQKKWLSEIDKKVKRK